MGGHNQAMNQPDFFENEDQSELFSADEAPRVYRADPDRVRERMRKILTEAKAAEVIPWEPRRLALYRTIFPQMSLWLPEEEAAQMCFEFEAELSRLKAA
jgi:hypothetical protein